MQEPEKDTHRKFMMEAIKEAEKALKKKEVPVGGIIVCKDRIIARAHNLTEQLKDPTAHAEMQLITMATHYLGGKYLKECTLYITLEPCPMCAAALSWAQLTRLVFGASDPKKGFRLFSPSLLHPKTDVVSGILEKECGEMLSSFFKTLR